MADERRGRLCQLLKKSSKKSAVTFYAIYKQTPMAQARQVKQLIHNIRALVFGSAGNNCAIQEQGAWSKFNNSISAIIDGAGLIDC